MSNDSNTNKLSPQDAKKIKDAHNLKLDPKFFQKHNSQPAKSTITREIDER